MLVQRVCGRRCVSPENALSFVQRKERKKGCIFFPLKVLQDHSVNSSGKMSSVLTDKLLPIRRTWLRLPWLFTPPWPTLPESLPLIALSSICHLVGIRWRRRNKSSTSKNGTGISFLSLKRKKNMSGEAGLWDQMLTFGPYRACFTPC